MNFIFLPYPTHPWIPDWTFEPSGCNTAYRENCADHFFKTQETVGRVAPNSENPGWALQIPVPQNSRINLLSNGFCAYFEHRKIKCGAEVVTPEPGILWGRFTGIPNPVLTAGQPMGDDGEFQWLETDTLNALLAVRGDAFCLVTKARIHGDAVKVAEDYLQRNIEIRLEEELERRAGAVALLEDMAHHDSLTVICVETMIKALRPAEGKISHVWSQASSSERPLFDINELYCLVLAWTLVDINVAEELLLCALGLQTNAGAIPVLYSPHATFSVLEAPKPVLAKAAEKVWEVRRDQTYLDTILPLLRRHIQWLLHHFDPKRRGIYSWKTRNEPIVPELFETDLATVDLAVLLLSEIEALNRLRIQSSKHAAHPPYFEEERSGIEHSMLDQFWNDADSAFSNAYVRNTIATLHGFATIAPLLWSNLPSMQKSAILERAHESGSPSVPGKLNVLSWRQSALDDHSFPVMQQFLVFQALKTADPHGTLLSEFSRLTLQGFVEWHTVSMETGNALHVQPVMAAYIVNIQAMHQYRYHAKGGVAGKLFRILRKAKADRTDLAVIATTVFLIFGVRALYDVKNQAPPFAMLEAQMNSAYADKNATETLRNCQAIVEYYPAQASMAQLLSANILMLSGQFDMAGELFAEVRKVNPDSPGAMISLGLALQLQGRFAEAESNYYEFCYLFDEIFPDVVRDVNRFRFLMLEGFRAPPKWQEIYRYQFMHEL